MLTKNDAFERLRKIFSFDRTACRVFGAWVCFAYVVLWSVEGFSELSFAQGTSLVTVGLYVLLFFVLFSALAFFVPRFHTDSWVLFAASTLCVHFWLSNAPYAIQRLLFALAVAVAYSLIVIYCVRANADLLSKWQPKNKTITIFAIAAGVVSCVIISMITCLRYLTFSSPNFDFGLFCNMFHNMAESGAPMVTSERDQLLSHFAVHISPVYYLLLPFYWLLRSPLVLQIGQAVVLALGVIPVVLLARHFKLSGKATIVVSLLYAFYPAITRGTFYDIHENCFLTLFLLLTFLFYEKKRYIPMYLSALLVLSVKEDAAIYILFFAIFLLLSERDWKNGSILAALAVGYFILCGYILEKHGLGMMVNRFDNLIYNNEDGLIGAVKTLLVNPGYFLSELFTTKDWDWQKIAYVLQLLLPIGLLPFCTKRPSRWLLLAPILINIATDYVYQYDVGFQYHFGITAFLFYAVIKNLPELTPPTRKTLLAVSAAVCACIYIGTVVPTLSHYTKSWGENREQYEEMDAFLDTIPDDASVSASTFLLAHIADRDEIYEVHYHGNKPDVDYVVLDIRSTGYERFRDAYFAQGYTVHSELKDKILVLKR